jgi:serine/threonine protein phosphatase PrpC
MIKSPTFFVGAQSQKKNLQDFQRCEQQLAEAYHKNKPLCFSGRGYQKTHPVKARRPGHRDADATIEAPFVLGVADGVSQIEDFGIDASLLPNELLRNCEEIAMNQLFPDGQGGFDDSYRGPIPLVREAFETTESLGSTTLVLAVLDNSTRIHGKLHPMIAVISIGDCELMILRRLNGKGSPLTPVFHTEMQRIDGHVQTPLQLARVDARIDPDFHEGITIEVIEKGSAVHCISAYEGDVVIMGSDGVFDNLFLDEVADLANSALPPGRTGPTHEALLGHLAKRVVDACHAKTEPGPNGMLPEAPIGRGGKMDDTSCCVGEVIEWTDSQRQIWAPRRRKWQWQPWQNFMSCSISTGCTADDEDEFEEYDDDMLPPGSHTHKTPRTSRVSASRQSTAGDDYDTDYEDGKQCTVS